jgi:hypothetical protein
VDLAAVDRLARHQLGLISVAQLAGIGVSVAARRGLIERGVLVPVRRGVYRTAGSPETWPATVMGAVLAAGPGAVASHATAARLWHLVDGLRRPAPEEAAAMAGLHVSSARHPRLAGVVAHRARLASDECQVLRAVPVTTLERTLLDLASLLGPASLGGCVDAALRQGARLERLRSIAERHAGRGPCRRWPLHEVLAERLPGYDPGANSWERRMDDLWEAMGLPAAERQYAVVVNGRRYVLDRAIVELRIGVEWVGFEYHGQRGRFDRDSFRRADLQGAGWELIEVTSRWSPERICHVVSAAADRRRPVGHASKR